MNAIPGPVMVGDQLYGAIVLTTIGFVFIPSRGTHVRTRTAHATPAACLPRYVRAALKQHAKETK